MELVYLGFGLASTANRTRAGAVWTVVGLQDKKEFVPIKSCMEVKTDGVRGRFPLLWYHGCPTRLNRGAHVRGHLAAQVRPDYPPS